MKWIRNRNVYLNEAKIRDVILPKQAQAVKDEWGDNFLELEEIEATNKINQGKWKLTDKEKIEALGIFFNANLEKVYDFFDSLPNELSETIDKSLDYEVNDDRINKILNGFNIKFPTINQISILSENIFRKISMSESTSDSIMIRDETGRPVMGEDKKPMKRKREDGEVIFSTNLVNINGFLDDYNKLFPEKQVDAFKFASGDIQKVISSSKEDFAKSDYTVEVDVYNRDLFLSIDHNPKDILNMSVSRFYASCQHLYTGCYREQVIYNVFDPNSIPAFLLFDSPIYDPSGSLLSETLSLSRMMIRNIEKLEETKEVDLFFDRAYPDRMKTFMDKMVEKYSNNVENTSSNDVYIFTPDLPMNLKSGEPYMDMLDIKEIPYIGKNATNIIITNEHDWSVVKVSPNSNVKEISIETVNIPSNLLDLKLNLDVLKFKHLKLYSISDFNKIKSKSWIFDKCKFNNNILVELNETHNIKILQLISCDIKDLDLSKLDLDELHLIFTVDDLSIIDNLKLKKLVISSDIVDKKYISELKSKGVKIQIIGPKI